MCGGLSLDVWGYGGVTKWPTLLPVQPVDSSVINHGFNR